MSERKGDHRNQGNIVKNVVSNTKQFRKNIFIEAKAYRENVNMEAKTIRRKDYHRGKR